MRREELMSLFFLPFDYCCKASQWEDQLKFLSSQASRVVALDLLGCGLSQVDQQ